MKKTVFFALSLLSVATVLSCSKDKDEDESVELKYSQVMIDGKVSDIPVQAVYVNVPGQQNPPLNASVEADSPKEAIPGFHVGIRGDVIGKVINLASPIQEGVGYLDFVVLYWDDKDRKDYEMILEEGELTYNMNGQSGKGSPFKSGELKVVYNDEDKTCTADMEGELKDGTKVAARIKGQIWSY